MKVPHTSQKELNRVVCLSNMIFNVAHIDVLGIDVTTLVIECQPLL